MPPRRVVVLSYADVSSANLLSLRRAARDRDLDLVEVEPHRLGLRVDDGAVLPTLDGGPFASVAVLHRTIARLTPLVRQVLAECERRGTVVLNDVARALVARDKLAAAVALQQAGLPVVPQFGFFPGTRHVAAWHGEVVTKPALGVRGEGVEFWPSAAVAFAGIHADLREPEPWVQHWLLEPALGEPGTDLRAFVVGGVCQALMRRRAAPGERRANLVQGGRGECIPLPHPAGRLAERAVAALGLDYAGVDLLDDPARPERARVLEVEAWAGFAGLEQVCGVDAAGAVLDLLLARLDEAGA